MLQVHDGFNPTMQRHEAVVLGDGRKPICKPGFMCGEITLHSEWKFGQPEEMTRGNLFRKDYAEVLRMRRGVWHLQANGEENGWINLTIDAYDTSSIREGKNIRVLRFDQLKFKYEDQTLLLMMPDFKNDGYNVMIEEALSSEHGILVPAFQALASAVLDRKTGPVYAIPSDRKRRTVEVRG